MTYGSIPLPLVPFFGVALALLVDAGGPVQDPPSDGTMRGWVERLGAMYEVERQEARKQLAAAGQAAEKRLVAGLDHADHRVRKGCLDLLSAIDAPSGVDRAAAIFRTRDEDRAVKAAAFQYLKGHASKAEDLFIDALEHPDETYRAGAVATLTEIKSTRALPKAAALFERETVKAIKDRIFELLKAAGEPARPSLLALLANADAAVRQEALIALIEIETPPEDLVEPVTRLLKLEVTPQLLEDAFDVFARAGEKAIPHLLEGLRSPSPEVRRKALDAVTHGQIEAALDGVAELYHRETTDEIRRLALDYLVAQGLRAEPALIKAFDSPLPAVRIEAISALGRIRSEKVFDRVALLYRNEKDAHVRLACFEYLESVGLRAEDELIAAVKDVDDAICVRAVRALGTAGSEKAIGPIADLLTKDDKPAIRAEAVEALASIGDQAVEFLREAAKAGHVRAADADDVVAVVNQVVVERFLDTLISEDGSTGTWPGQFEGLAALGKDRVMPVLWKMAAEAEFSMRFREPAKRTLEYPSDLQCLAILAIGELGDAPALARLKELKFPAWDERHREQLVALHRLGDKESLDAFVAAELKEGREFATGNDPESGYRKLFNAALLKARIGAREEALKIYLELVETVRKARARVPYKDVPRAHYNIACLHAAAGRKAEAVAALARAVELGFRDFAWILKDKELDPIRGEEGYRKLLAEAEPSQK